MRRISTLLFTTLCGCGSDGGSPTPAPDAGRPLVATECSSDTECGPGGMCRIIGNASAPFGFCYPASRSVCSARLCCADPFQCMGSPFGQRDGYCFSAAEAATFCARMPPGLLGCTTTGTVNYVPCRP